MTWEAAVELIRQEVERAKTKHPDWPTDPVYQAAIVAEESGELVRAALQHKREGADDYPIFREAIQTAATCVRLLMNQ